MLLVLLFTSLVGRTEPVCLQNSYCPTNIENFELAFDPRFSPETNSILSELSACRSTFLKNVGANLDKKAACISSLYNCSQTMATEGRLLPQRMSRAVDCATSPISCASLVANSLSKLPILLNELSRIRSSVPPAKRREMICAASGYIGPDIVLGLGTGFALVKAATKLLALVEALPILSAIIESSDIAVDSIKAIMFLDKANLDQAFKLLQKGELKYLDKAINTCSVGAL